MISGIEFSWDDDIKVGFSKGGWGDFAMA